MAESTSGFWQKRSIVWLSGVRRVGKTTLCRMLPTAELFNCDLPSVRQRLEDPELFFRSLGPRLIVLDEIHRLGNPSEVLKIAADEFPKLKILATGSSTLAATHKFRDSLTGRKTSVFLPPVLWSECLTAFEQSDLDHRLLSGGLPELLQEAAASPDFFAEWLDSFYARDIQELFGIRERTGFLSLLRLLLRQSGGMADFSALSRECGLSRPTVKAHLEALSISLAVYPVLPLHGGGIREIVKRPRLYAFDTGFIAFERGFEKIRDEDRGLLWEHLTLDTLRVAYPGRQIHFWRDKSGREIDFVIREKSACDVFECKMNPERFSTDSLEEFRRAYPEGRNHLVCPAVHKPWIKRSGEFRLTICSLEHLLAPGKDKGAP